MKKKLGAEAILLLEDGTKFYGNSFGSQEESCGEVCFNTSMTGYQEIITDPSYAGQIVTMTYPMIGNYGTNDFDNQAQFAHIKGFVVKEYSNLHNNWEATQSLEEFLIKHNIPGIEGVDTRALTRHIRDKGSMRGIIAKRTTPESQLIETIQASPKMEGQDLASVVSSKKEYSFSNEGKFNVIAYDFGAKLNILRQLKAKGCKVTVVPATTSWKKVLEMKPDGIFLSNGPGDPAAVTYAIENVKQLLTQDIPIFGICLGHQILCLALGASTFKLRFGHRGGNQPVKNLETETVEITAQNHGFAVTEESLKPLPVKITHTNLNDKTIEGIKHTKNPVFSVQYHPEAAPGPNDAKYLFENFIQLMNKKK